MTGGNIVGVSYLILALVILLHLVCVCVCQCSHGQDVQFELQANTVPKNKCIDINPTTNFVLRMNVRPDFKGSVQIKGKDCKESLRMNAVRLDWTG